MVSMIFIYPNNAILSSSSTNFAKKMTEQVFCLIVLLVAVLHVNTECPPSTGMTTTNDTHTQLILYSLYRYILDVRRTVYI